MGSSGSKPDAETVDKLTSYTPVNWKGWRCPDKWQDNGLYKFNMVYYTSDGQTMTCEYTDIGHSFFYMTFHTKDGKIMNQRGHDLLGTKVDPTWKSYETAVCVGDDCTPEGDHASPTVITVITVVTSPMATSTVTQGAAAPNTAAPNTAAPNTAAPNALTDLGFYLASTGGSRRRRRHLHAGRMSRLATDLSELD